MKSEFIGYYAPAEAAYDHLWQEGLIVLDTNVLLDLYRLPASAKDELISVLEKLKDRLWVPYQVALEYQRRRLTVISSERKATEETLSDANALFGSVQDKVIKLQIERRGLGIDAGPLLQDLQNVSQKLVEAIDAVHEAQLDIAITDPIRDKLDELLEGKVGPAPATQVELDALTDGGQARYDNNIGPGFADADKDKNPKEATFYHDGLLYPRKFGDLILWRQLISHAKSQNKKYVLFVTSDRKEDWWWKEKGKTIGPRSELCREIYREGDVEVFWMYSAVQFLENSKKYTKIEVSDEAVNELKEVARISSRANLVDELKYFRSDINQSHFIDSKYKPEIDFVVGAWLRETFSNVARCDGFPDFLVQRSSGIFGYEYISIGNVNRISRNSKIVHSLTLAETQIREGAIKGFGLILIIDADELNSMGPDELDYMKPTLLKLTDTYSCSDLVVGYVDKTGKLQPIYRANPNGWQDT